MFCKINYDFSKFQRNLINIIDGGYYLGCDDNGKLFVESNRRIDYAREGIYTNYISQDKNTNIFTNIIPDIYKGDWNLEIVTQVAINRKVEPHVDMTNSDTNKSCSINFYLEAGNHRTVFYKNLNKIDGDTEPISHEFGPGAALLTFKYSDLEEIGSFIAKPYEVYLLDVNMIHSVEKLIESPDCDEIKPRQMLRFNTTKYGYDEVYEMLKENKYI